MSPKDLAAVLRQTADQLEQPLDLGCATLAETVKSAKALVNDMSLEVKVLWYDHMNEPKVEFVIYDATAHKHIRGNTLPELLAELQTHVSPPTTPPETTLEELGQLAARS